MPMIAMPGERRKGGEAEKDSNVADGVCGWLHVGHRHAHEQMGAAKRDYWHGELIATRAGIRTALR
jgi:hypothetical protein